MGIWGWLTGSVVCFLLIIVLGLSADMQMSRIRRNIEEDKWLAWWLHLSVRDRQRYFDILHEMRADRLRWRKARALQQGKSVKMSDGSTMV